MLRRLLTIFLFSTLAFSAQAQLDSLKRALESSPNDQSRLYTLINLGNELMSTDAIAANDYIAEALQISYALNDKRAEGFCHNTLGSINYEARRYDVAVEYFKKAIVIFEEQSESQGLYIATRYIARCYDGIEDYGKSLVHYQRFLELAERAGNKEDVAETQEEIGRVYYNMGEYAEAKVWYEKAVPYFSEQGDQTALIDLNDALGDIELALNLDSAALFRYNASQQLSEQIGDNRRAGESYTKIGNVYGRNKDRKKQLEYEQQALTYNTQNNNSDLANSNYLNIGKLYVEDNNAAEAIPFLHKSIDLANGLGMLEEKGEALQVLSDAYEEIGDYDNAIESYRQYVEIVDSLRQQELEENLIALRLSSDLNRTEEQVELLEQERELQAQRITLMEQEDEAREATIQQQKIVTWSLVGALILISLSAFFVYRSARQKRRANQLLALQSLRSQMNPHFIFNSLNSVNSFIAMNDERSANKYLSEFSRLMRAVMENSKHDFVPLASELDILKLYLNLEHVRFKDKFDYTFTVDEEIDADHVQIPPMLVQPYIENAIWHGLRYRPEKGELHVNIRPLDEQHLVVVIEDNGIGREKSQELKTKNQKATRSTGMRNIQERLNIINEIHGTRLKVKISDGDPESEFVGTRVEIAVPLQQLDTEESV